MGVKYSDLYVYNLLEEGTIEIVRYIGREKDIRVPCTIDGYIVSSIANAAFALFNNDFGNVCSAQSIEVPYTVISVGDSAFEMNFQLTTVRFLNPYTRIGKRAFLDCNSLVSISLPSALEIISPYMFHGCSALAHISIPASVKRIGSNAFELCNSLENVYLPSVRFIGRSAFSNCDSLHTVFFFKNTLNIGARAFECCKQLREIVLPDTITKIGDAAFLKCDSLIRVVLPNSLSFLGKGVFFGCDKLVDMRLPQSNTSFSFVGNALYEIATKTLVYYPASCSEEHYYVPKGTLAINDGAFSGNLKLSFVSLPSTIQSFSGSAFFGSNLHGLSFYEANDLYTIDENAVYNRVTKELIFYPQELYCEMYSVQEGTTTISDCALSSNFNTGVYIPNSVQTIGCRAFSESLLSEICIPASVTEIKDGAFSFCSNLEKVVLPDNIKNINASTFELCYSLRIINIPQSVEVILEKAFWGCQSLESLFIPNSVIYIAEDAFEACDNMTISVNKGSYAHDYVLRHNIKYACV